MNWSEHYTELSYLLPVGVILGAALIVVFLDLVLDHNDRYVLPWLSLTGCVLAGIATLQIQPQIAEHSVWFRSTAQGQGAALPLILGGSFCLDTFATMVWIICCIAGAVAVLISPQHPRDSALSAGEYFGLMLLAVAGMMLLAASHDFLTLLISLEIMSISTYILTGSERDDVRSNEAGLKYLLLGAFSTAFLLMGIAFYYGAFGNISLNASVAFATLVHEEPTRELFVFVALGMILVGILFKVGAAPFHFWIPDVYEGAPTAVTGLMAVGVKAAAFAVVARLLMETFGAYGGRWVWLIRLFSVLTMVIGNILAMRQKNLKRMLAYSGIAHTGYLLLAFLSVSMSSGAVDEHIKAVVFYLLSYGVMTLGAFSVISLTREDGKALDEMDNYAGLAKENPGIALCMTLFMLSLAGMPPMAGFFGKFLVFREAVNSNEVVPVVLGILTSVASLYYYLRVIVSMYMSPANDESPSAPPAAQARYSWAADLLIYAMGIATLIIGLLPERFY